MATLDHIGLNRYIHMSASVDDMTLGSLDIEQIKNEHSESVISSTLDDSRLLLGINLYNNGPYGHSSWQQLRMSENPLHRYLRKNNKYPIVFSGKEKISFKNGKRSIIPERYGPQVVLDEPSVVSNYKPVTLVGSVDEHDSRGRPSFKRFIKKMSIDNNISYFTNEVINRIANLKEEDDEAYEILKKYYLENGLESSDSPMSSFDRLVYSQTIYPPQKYTYKSYTRERLSFSFPWNSNIEERNKNELDPLGRMYDSNGDSVVDTPVRGFVDNFSITAPLVLSDRLDSMGNPLLNFPAKTKASVWPLDVDGEWADRGQPLITNLGITQLRSTTAPRDAFTGGQYHRRRLNNGSFGILWNYYSVFTDNLDSIDISKVT